MSKANPLFSPGQSSFCTPRVVCYMYATEILICVCRPYTAEEHQESSAPALLGLNRSVGGQGGRDEAARRSDLVWKTMAKVLHGREQMASVTDTDLIKAE